MQYASTPRRHTHASPARTSYSFKEIMMRRSRLRPSSVMVRTVCVNVLSLPWLRRRRRACELPALTRYRCSTSKSWNLTGHSCKQCKPEKIEVNVVVDSCNNEGFQCAIEK